MSRYKAIRNTCLESALVWGNSLLGWHEIRSFSETGKGKTMAELSRGQFEQRLAEMASEKPEFRKKLLADPKGAIAEFLKTHLPAELTVVVHEEDENTMHFVLPPAGDELSAAELAGVVGGTSGEKKSWLWR